jgi:hypothetical protein
MGCHSMTNLSDKTDYEILGMSIVGEIPEDFHSVLEALNLRDDYELARSMGLGHEEAYHTVLAIKEPYSQELN